MDRRFIIYSFILVFLSVIQAYFIIESVRLGLHSEAAFWVGAIFFGVTGFFFYDIDIWLTESNTITRIIVLVPLIHIMIFSQALLEMDFTVAESFFTWLPLLFVISILKMCVNRDLTLPVYEAPMFHAEKDRPFIKVIKTHWLGRNIQYALFFVEDGFVAIGIGGPFTNRKARTRAALLIKEKMDEVSIDEIMAKNEVNFKIPYTDVYGVELHKRKTKTERLTAGILTIKGNREDKFYIWDEKDTEICRNNLYQFLPAIMITEL